MLPILKSDLKSDLKKEPLMQVKPDRHNTGTFIAIMMMCVLMIITSPVVAKEAPAQPRLILQITVDALRGDLLNRYDKVLGEGGFRYLLDNGINYNNAHYQHANTETIVGHTSLATGAAPAAHGMVANVWFDRDKDRLVYNIEDANYHLLTAGADVDKQTEIDPTQKTAKVDGRSPNNIMTSTLSDEIAISFAGRSKIFAVSVKDRGAVALAGHAGKAFWFSKASGEFVTSNYYYDRYPDWVVEWNTRKPANAFADKSWQLLRKPSDYLFADADDREYETDLAGFGRVFPHAFGQADDKYFTTKLTLSPAGDALTLDFSKTLLDKEKLGQDDVPDYLAISFSSTDYVGHIFGASSLESEDNIAQLDRTLADLFAYVDKKVGLENTLIVLSADHGQPEVPGYLHGNGIAKASYFDVEALDNSSAIAAIKQLFGLLVTPVEKLGDKSGEPSDMASAHANNKPKQAKLIEAYFHPYLYLNHKLIDKKGLDQAAIEQTLVDELLKYDGIAYAVSSAALRTNSVPDNAMIRSIKSNYHPKRSGDIYVVFQPDVFINDFDGLTVSSTHGSPWRYDTFVPVIFAGAGLPAATVSRAITPYDIAATITTYLNIKPPSGSTGTPLKEVLAK
jgi:predicted AlkP superfamily pyrophosphatase or phosphodiesterase